MTGPEIHKTTLREFLQKRHYSGQSYELTSATRSSANVWDVDSLRNKVLGIWASAIGVEEDSLALNSPISEFADSLTIARVRGEIRRGIPGSENLSAQDISNGDTHSGQVEMIIGRLSRCKNLNSEIRNNDGQNFITAADMVIIFLCHLRRLKSPNGRLQAQTIAQPSHFETTKKTCD